MRNFEFHCTEGALTSHAPPTKTKTAGTARRVVESHRRTQPAARANRGSCAVPEPPGVPRGVASSARGSVSESLQGSWQRRCDTVNGSASPRTRHGRHDGRPDGDGG